MLKPGQVLCIDASKQHQGLELNKWYTAFEVTDICVYLLDEHNQPDNYGWYKNRFISKSDLLREVHKIKNII